MKLFATFFAALIIGPLAFAMVPTFSDTQQWGQEELYFLTNWKPIFSTASHQSFLAKKFHFPSRSETKKEVDELLRMQHSRTASQKKTIEREKHVCGFVMNGFRLGKNVALDKLVLDSYFDARKWGFALKKHYDRVRPSYFDSRIQPSIENPPHAAYPSNHSFQAHVIAHVLGDVYPNERDHLLKAAASIAKNREIAGVHYPSDSAFGKLLAASFHHELNKDPRYRSAVESSKGTKWILSQTPDSSEEYSHCIDITRRYANQNEVWPKPK